MAVARLKQFQFVRAESVAARTIEQATRWTASSQQSRHGAADRIRASTKTFVYGNGPDATIANLEPMDVPALPPAGGSSPPSEKPLWRSPEYQRFWLSIQTRKWRTLALVPASDGQAEDFTLQIAMALARTGMTHLGAQVHVADATTLTMAASNQFTAQVRASTQSGPVLIALAPRSKNPVTTPIAQDADCAVLCVKLGQMKLSEAKRTIQEIGPTQFIGSLAVR